MGAFFYRPQSWKEKITEMAIESTHRGIPLVWCLYWLLRTEMSIVEIILGSVDSNTDIKCT